MATINYTECESTLDGLSYIMRSKNPDLAAQGQEKLLNLRRTLESLDSPRAGTLVEKIDYVLSTKNTVAPRKLSDAIEELYEEKHYLNDPVVVSTLIFVFLLAMSIYTATINKSLSAIGKN